MNGSVDAWVGGNFRRVPFVCGYLSASTGCLSRQRSIVGDSHYRQSKVGDPE